MEYGPGRATCPSQGSGVKERRASRGALAGEEEGAAAPVRTLQSYQHEATPDPAPQAEAAQGRR